MNQVIYFELESFYFVVGMCIVVQSSTVYCAVMTLIKFASMYVNKMTSYNHTNPNSVHHIL